MQNESMVRRSAGLRSPQTNSTPEKTLSTSARENTPMIGVRGTPTAIHTVIKSLIRTGINGSIKVTSVIQADAPQRWALASTARPMRPEAEKASASSQMQLWISANALNMDH